MNRRTQQLDIRTPEGVSFSLPLAGPISRCLAWLLDAVCIMAAAKLLGTAAGLLGLFSRDFSSALNIILFFLLSIGYAMALEWYWHGQTLGKRMLGIRVMDIRGLRLSPSQIILRNLLRAVDSLPLVYLLGGCACLISRYAQRLGDLAANTVVIKEMPAVQPDLALLLEDNRYNSLRAYPHLVARLRQRVSPAEAGLALQALLRRKELAPEARVSLFHDIEILLKAKIVFPHDATQGVSAEQYVRNVVDVLFRSQRPHARNSSTGPG